MTQHRMRKQDDEGARKGRLSARLTQSVVETRPGGLYSLELGKDRDGLLYVPSSYQMTAPAPFVLMLHGAGSNARSILTPFIPLAESSGLLLLAPDSRQQTWDFILNRFGSDVSFIERALEVTFGRYAIDPKHVAIGGFSDGASYALSLGLTNGDLFSHIVAFSPGFMAPAEKHGSPRIYISHGIHDRILPIERCSRRIVPELRSEGYDVSYQEFDDGHTVPGPIVGNAFAWFMGTMDEKVLPEAF